MAMPSWRAAALRSVFSTFEAMVVADGGFGERGKDGNDERLNMASGNAKLRGRHSGCHRSKIWG